jgi:hypothetical protein
VNTLKRYGVIWVSDTTPITSPMKDGYWTPWYLAQDRIAELEKALESAKFFRVDVVRCLSKIAWEHNHNEIPQYMNLAKKCILEIEEQSKQAKGGAE